LKQQSLASPEEDEVVFKCFEGGAASQCGEVLLPLLLESLVNTSSRMRRLLALVGGEGERACRGKQWLLLDCELKGSAEVRSGAADGHLHAENELADGLHDPRRVRLCGVVDGGREVVRRQLDLAKTHSHHHDVLRTSHLPARGVSARR
jgi:hypothetical protein